MSQTSVSTRKRTPYEVSYWLPAALIIVVLLVPLALVLGFSANGGLNMAANVVLLIATWKRMRPAIICGYFVFAAFLTSTAIAGFLLSRTITNNTGVALSRLRLSPEEHHSTVLLLITASNAILIGGLLASIAVKSRGLEPYKIRESTSELFTRLSAIILVVAGGNLLLALSLNGVDSYLERPEYHLETSGGLAGLPDLVAIASVVVLGALLASSKRNIHRGLAVTLILAYWIYFFSLATRAFALLPLLVALGMACVTRGRWLPWFVAAMGLLSVSLLELPLFLRGLQHHGIIPYGEALSDIPLFQSNPVTTASNFLAGFHVVGATAYSSPPIPMDMFWVSVAPQSGNAAGWYEVSETLRLGPALPYAAVGEVGNQGLTFAFAFYFLIGFVLGLLHRSIVVIVERLENPLGAIVLIGLQFNMIILATQYNLRSGMRSLYYAIALAGIILLIGALSASFKRRDVGPSRRDFIGTTGGLAMGRQIQLKNKAV